MDRFEWIATAAFGLEGLVARELARLGIEAKAENGGARFFGSFEDAFRANLYARCADRILLVMGRFEARSFEALFEGVRALPWEDFIGEHTRFPVNGKCARSQLMSVRDCQAITKKAIVERAVRGCGEAGERRDGGYCGHRRGRAGHMRPQDGNHPVLHQPRLARGSVCGGDGQISAEPGRRR